MLIQTQPVVLGKKPLRENFLIALKSCEDRKKIQPGYIDHNRISFLPSTPSKTEADKAKAYDIEARQIAKALREAQRAVIVDGDSLESGLTIVNQYKGPWKIYDDVYEKLNIVIYDPEYPSRAAVLQNINEALLLLQKFRDQNKAIFITLPGYAYNFHIDLGKSGNEIEGEMGVELSTFGKIIEIEPDKVWPLIISKIIAGKTIFIHEPLLRKNPAICVMANSLGEDQRDRINVVKERKGF